MVFRVEPTERNTAIFGVVFAVLIFHAFGVTGLYWYGMIIAYMLSHSCYDWLDQVEAGLQTERMSPFTDATDYPAESTMWMEEITKKQNDWLSLRHLQALSVSITCTCALFGALNLFDHELGNSIWLAIATILLGPCYSFWSTGRLAYADEDSQIFSGTGRLIVAVILATIACRCLYMAFEKL